MKYTLLILFLLPLLVGCHPVVCNDKLREIHSSIKNINNGGCGFFAYYMYQNLNEPDRFRIALADSGKHVCLLNIHDSTWLDSYGFETFEAKSSHTERGINYFTFITPQTLRRMLDTCPWNNKFNRGDTTILIEQLKLAIHK